MSAEVVAARQDGQAIVERWCRPGLMPGRSRFDGDEARDQAAPAVAMGRQHLQLRAQLGARYRVGCLMRMRDRRHDLGDAGTVRRLAYTGNRTPVAVAVAAGVGTGGTITGVGMDISAAREGDVKAKAIAGSAGVAAGVGAGATATDTGTVSVVLASNASLNAGTGSLNIAAKASPAGDSQAIGVAVGGAAVGASIALSTASTRAPRLCRTQVQPPGLAPRSRQRSPGRG